jgi:hypothetical protein
MLQWQLESAAAKYCQGLKGRLRARDEVRPPQKHEINIQYSNTQKYFGGRHDQHHRNEIAMLSPDAAAFLRLLCL